VLAATLLLHQCFGLINEDIGPDPNYVWVALVYSLTLAIGLTFVGRLSDIFGRRWFFIGGALIALVGAVVCASAKSIPMLIGGETLIGLGPSSQLSFPFAMGELVPVKHRFLGHAILYLSCFPFSGFGPAVANAVVLHTGPGWRMGYWLLVIIDFLSLACYVVFYRPPTFHMKHKIDIMHWIKHFDYIGGLLFTGGILLFLMGLSWGGSVHPWKSAHVIGCMVVGFITCITFVMWECFAPLTEPLMPMRLFRNWKWVACWASLGLGAGQYYALAIVWPLMVSTLYDDGDMMKGGYMASVVGLGILSGQIVGGVLARYIGKTKYQAITVFSLGGMFYGCK
jgi:MFS family permease